jgi:hypothetical protein
LHSKPHENGPEKTVYTSRKSGGIRADRAGGAFPLSPVGATLPGVRFRDLLIKVNK